MGSYTIDLFKADAMVQSIAGVLADQAPLAAQRRAAVSISSTSLKLSGISARLAASIAAPVAETLRTMQVMLFSAKLILAARLTLRRVARRLLPFGFLPSVQVGTGLPPSAQTSRSIMAFSPLGA